MPFLNILSPIFSFLTNPKVIIAMIVAGLIYYHFHEVNSLKATIETNNTNIVTLTETNKENVKTIEKIEKELKTSKESKDITDKSYVDEIASLKTLIEELNKKPVFNGSIVVKPDSKSECVVHVKKITPADSNSSIIRLISEIGK